MWKILHAGTLENMFSEYGVEPDVHAEDNKATDIQVPVGLGIRTGSTIDSFFDACDAFLCVV